MKKLIGFGLLTLFFLAATAFISKEKPTENSLEGTWKLVNRYNWEDGNVVDTLANINGYSQVKIYSKGKVMWTRYSPDDPNEYFGYGSYINTQTTLEERLEYGSKMMMTIQDTVKIFKFELQLDKESYSQISVDKNGNRTFSENYTRID